MLEPGHTDKFSGGYRRGEIYWVSVSGTNSTRLAVDKDTDKKTLMATGWVIYGIGFGFSVTEIPNANRQKLQIEHSVPI